MTSFGAMADTDDTDTDTDTAMLLRERLSHTQIHDGDVAAAMTITFD